MIFKNKLYNITRDEVYNIYGFNVNINLENQSAEIKFCIPGNIYTTLFFEGEDIEIESEDVIYYGEVCWISSFDDYNEDMIFDIDIKKVRFHYKKMSKNNDKRYYHKYSLDI